MADAIFIGGAATAAQVNNHTPSNEHEGDIFALALADEDGVSTTISYTCLGGTTVQIIVEALVALAAAAKAAGDVPWSKVTATEDNLKVIITATTAGVPFTVTSSTTGGTWTDTTPTACSGPSVYSCTENWLGGAIPVSTNNVYIASTVTEKIYGYNGATGVEMASFTIEEGCLADIGSPFKPLQIDVANSGVITLWGTGTTYLAPTGASASVNVNAAGTGNGVGTYGLYLSTGEAGMVLTVACATASERVAVAAQPGATGTFATVQGTGGYVFIDAQATVTTVTAAGAEIHCEDSVTTFNVKSGVAYREGAGTAGALYVLPGATLYEHSTGTVTEAFISGTVNCDLQARIWSATDCYSGYSISDPFKTITHTGHVSYHYCDQTSHDRGVDMNVVYSAVS